MNEIPKTSSVDSEPSVKMEAEDPLQHPPSPERIPAWPLWRCLGIPPLLVLVVNLSFAIPKMEGNALVSIWSVILPIILLGIIPGLAFHFSDTVRVRYRGTSLTFLVWSYVLGEIIICMSLFVGSCIAISFRS